MTNRFIILLGNGEKRVKGKILVDTNIHCLFNCERTFLFYIDKSNDMKFDS